MRFSYSPHHLTLVYSIRIASTYQNVWLLYPNLWGPLAEGYLLTK